MKNAIVRFVLVLFVAALSAVAAYLKERLTDYLRRTGDDNDYDPDFACC
ncbi:hypothetical protein BCAR13_890063 [Paraburkholderia caribensis]|nr:hypothetical protein [Paraburkholderia caribensis]CAG9239504.1 hypothetical protein BCAR13_890063 [Paraburkholderia caribensis]